MSKIEFKQNDVKNFHGKTYAFSYCQIENLLNYKASFGYSYSKSYGWRCDYYIFNDGKIIFSTGYAPVGQKVDCKIAEKFDNKAKKIIYDKSLDYEQKTKKVNNLLKKFIKYLENLEC